MRLLHPVTWLCLLSATASADVLLVNAAGPPGTYKHIQVAVNNAAPGDTVLIQGLGSVSFSEEVVIAGKSLSLLADDGITPRIRTLTIRDLPAGSVVVVRGLHADLYAPPSAGAAITIEACAGSVRLESLRAQGSHGTAGNVSPHAAPLNGRPGMAVTDCADVAARDCTITGGGGSDLQEEDTQFSPTSAGDGVVVTSSHVALYGCTLLGLKGGSVFDTVSDTAGSGGSGLRNVGGQVFMSGGSATGGNGGSGDCDVFGGSCGGGGAGGSGVRQEQATAALYLQDVAAAGGAGGYGPSIFGAGQYAKDGRPVTVNAGAFTDFTAAARQFSVSSPVREGSQLTLSFSGLAGDAAFVFAGLQVGQYVSQKAQGALLVTGHFTTPDPILMGGIAVTGSALIVTVIAPELPAGVQDAAFHLQSLFKPAGGSLLVGPASTTTVIDDDL